MIKGIVLYVGIPTKSTYRKLFTIAKYIKCEQLIRQRLITSKINITIIKYSTIFFTKHNIFYEDIQEEGTFKGCGKVKLKNQGGQQNISQQQNILQQQNQHKYRAQIQDYVAWITF